MLFKYFVGSRIFTSSFFVSTASGAQMDSINKGCWRVPITTTNTHDVIVKQRGFHRIHLCDIHRIYGGSQAAVKSAFRSVELDCQELYYCTSMETANEYPKGGNCMPLSIRTGLNFNETAEKGVEYVEPLENAEMWGLS